MIPTSGTMRANFNHIKMYRKLDRISSPNGFLWTYRKKIRPKCKRKLLSKGFMFSLFGPWSALNTQFLEESCAKTASGCFTNLNSNNPCNVGSKKLNLWAFNIFQSLDGGLVLLDWSLLLLLLDHLLWRFFVTFWAKRERSRFVS